MIGKNRWQMWRQMGFGFLLILSLLLFVGCDSTLERDFTPLELVSTPVPAELPEEVKTVRDGALKYIDSKYDVELPMSDADWTVEYDFQADCAGAGAYRLNADGCVVTISNPIIDLGSTIYHVILDDAEAGLHWEGDVDCLGQVWPSWSPVDDPTASVPGTINIVKMADLRNTVGIEVCRLDCASYTPLYTIGNPEFITSLVDALDSDKPLRPHAHCPAVYQLRFILADGQHYDFGYTCQMMTPTFLRGNQEFWMDQDAIAPDAFNELLLPLIAPESVIGYEW